MEHFISVPKTARYSLSAEPADQHTIWIVFHGYGQLSRYFIRKFEFLNPKENLVVAPEGFHRFYLEGFRGRVGASWMSKEDRLNDIQDSNSMLDLVLDEITARFNNKPRIRILAFSQGVATAIRWTLDSKIQTTDVLLWGGVFPPDVDFESQGHRLTDLKLRIVVGDQDEFYQGERRNRLHEALDAHRIPFVLSVVPGKHDIDQVAWEALSNP